MKLLLFLYLEWSGEVYFFCLFQAQSNEGDVGCFPVGKTKSYLDSALFISIMQTQLIVFDVSAYYMWFLNNCWKQDKRKTHRYPSYTVKIRNPALRCISRYQKHWVSHVADITVQLLVNGTVPGTAWSYLSWHLRKFTFSSINLYLISHAVLEVGIRQMVL